jgi:hypothetical protein
MTFLCGPGLEAGVRQHERGVGWPKPWALRCNGCREVFEYIAIESFPGDDVHLCNRCRSSTCCVCDLRISDGRALQGRHHVDGSPYVVHLACSPDTEYRLDGPACEWCSKPIPEVSVSGRRRRADAKTCSKACRQASWRFGQRGARFRLSGGALRVAYADPPYPGNATIYRDHPDFAGEVDHRELVERLVAEFPDGWALSTSADALRWVWPLCPDGSWVGAYVKSVPTVGTELRARRSWEPVIFSGGRPRPPDAPWLRDWVYARTLPSFPGHVVGMKPPDFSWWLFDCLGLQPYDELVDLFPGSGAVGLAWERFRRAPAGRDISPIGLEPVEASRTTSDDASRSGPGNVSVDAREIGRRARGERRGALVPMRSEIPGEVRIDLEEAS